MTEIAGKEKSAKLAIKNVIDEKGGIENIEASQFPRNEQQVRTLKRKIQAEKVDEITELLHEYDSQNDIFIRKIDVRPDFLVVLSTDQQLTDLKKFCTQHPYTVLGIDPTFHFGDFDVTVTTYRHMMLENTTPSNKMLNKCPVFVGPVCIHKKKDTQTYFNFFCTLIAHEKELRNLKVIGTDGETALSNATLMAFENAVHLRCFNHIQKNIKN